jgi:proline-specific peptidase
VEKLAEEGRPVVLYDQVGCGNSSRPPGNERDLTVFVDELSNLRTQLGLEEVFLLGTSWGGMVVLAYALARPSGLRALVLSSTLANASTWTSEAARLRDALREPHAEALRTGSPGEPAYDTAQEIFDARHVCRVPDTPEMQRMRKARNPEVYEAVWGPNEWTMLGSVGEWDVRRQLRDLDLPVLITAGEHDLCTQAVLNELQEGIRSAHTEVFEGTSHMPYLEDPDSYLTDLPRFLTHLDQL